MAAGIAAQCEQSGSRGVGLQRLCLHARRHSGKRFESNISFSQYFSLNGDYDSVTSIFAVVV